MHAIRRDAREFCLSKLETSDVVGTLPRPNHSGCSARARPFRIQPQHYGSLWHCTRCIRIASAWSSFRPLTMARFVQFQDRPIYCRLSRWVHRAHAHKWSKAKRERRKNKPRRLTFPLRRTPEIIVTSIQSLWMGVGMPPHLDLPHVANRWLFATTPNRQRNTPKRMRLHSKWTTRASLETDMSRWCRGFQASTMRRSINCNRPHANLRWFGCTLVWIDRIRICERCTICRPLPRPWRRCAAAPWNWCPDNWDRFYFGVATARPKTAIAVANDSGFVGFVNRHLPFGPLLCWCRCCGAFVYSAILSRLKWECKKLHTCIDYWAWSVMRDAWTDAQTNTLWAFYYCL